jgi:RNase P/RNase MRP subunit p29
MDFCIGVVGACRVALDFGSDRVGIHGVVMTPENNCVGIRNILEDPRKD